MRSAYSVFGAALVASIVLAACGGGGGGTGGTGGGTPATNPPPPSSAPPSSTGTATLGSTPQTVTLPAISNGSSGSVAFPATTSGSGTANVTLSQSQPSGAPTPAAATMHSKVTSFTICAVACTFNVLDYVVVTTPPMSITFPNTPAFTLTYPSSYSSALAGNVYLAAYDSMAAASGWNIVEQGSVNGLSVTFASMPGPVTFPANDTIAFAVVSSTGKLPATATPPPTTPPSSPPSTNPSATSSPLAGPTYLPQGSTQQGWAATPLANALDFPVQHGYGGGGQAIAIVIDAPADQGNLTLYLNDNGITRHGTVRDVQVNATQCTVTAQCGQDEGNLDLQTIAGLAPDANVYVYDIADLSFSNIVSAYNKIASDNLANVVSSSFGGCESPSIVNSAAGVIAQGAAKGIAFVASSGDQGNECYNNGNFTPGTSYPASDVNFIGVGGTQTARHTHNPLNTNIVWNDPVDNKTVYASGGGVSAVIAIPSYQAQFAGPRASSFSTSFRNEPDISMPAQDTFVENNPAGIFLGTSWSAPQFAAMLAEVFQYCGGAHSTNPAKLPYLAYAKNSAAFIDVITGNNQYAGSSPFYTTAPGYDNASGLGVPMGMTFANALCPNRTPASGFYGGAQSMSSVATHTLSYTQPLDVRAPVPMQELTDLGRRASDAQTNVQVVVAPGPNVASREAAVVSALQARGFTITQTFANHLVVNARGPAAAVEMTFSTQMRDVAQGRYGVRYMPATAVMVPQAIAENAIGVNIDNLIAFHHPIARRDY